MLELRMPYCHRSHLPQSLQKKMRPHEGPWPALQLTPTNKESGIPSDCAILKSVTDVMLGPLGRASFPQCGRPRQYPGQDFARRLNCKVACPLAI